MNDQKYAPVAPIDPASTLVDASGRPARKSTDGPCPGCGAGKEKRIASSGFGPAHPCCSRCGYQWIDEVWDGK